jgi:glycine/D-amino acid oxidase-like deaminating enzyme
VSTPRDVLIVGAGIVGAACAAECARAGLAVTVLDRGSIGGGTTGAGMGHLVVLDDSPAQFALTTFSRRLWLALAPGLPPAVAFSRCGTLWVAANAGELEEVHRKAAAYRQQGVAAEILDPATLREAEPNLRPGLSGALRVPDDAVVYPPAAAVFFLDLARHHGAQVHLGTGVQSLGADGTVRLADGSRRSAGVVVNATGCWAPSLTPGLPVRKRKGHLVITDRYPGYAHHQLVELGYLQSAHGTTADSVAFNLQPRPNGQMLLGSSRQFDAEGSEVDHALLARMIQRAFAYLPTLSRLAAVRIWTGHRAATPDKLPLIGPSLTSDRLWLATGHEGLGITTALATARLLVDRLLGRRPEIPCEPYQPARFAAGLPDHD